MRSIAVLRPLTLALVLGVLVSSLAANPVLVQVAAKPGVTGDPIEALRSSLRVGEPWHYKNLTIFPLTSKAVAPAWSFVTIERAVDRGVLEIKEKGSGEVNTVRVRNTGSSYVFGLAGDMIVGAKQDRMLQADVLIPPRSGWLELDVYCTEHGRWSGKTDRFMGLGKVVPNTVRARAAQTGSQQEVWAGVQEAKRALGDATPGSALQSVYNNQDVTKRSQEYIDELRPMSGRVDGMVGALVAVGDDIVCVDVFASPGLLAKMWDKLLRSYVMDALARSATGRLSRDEARDFLDELDDARRESRETPGAGGLYRFNTGRATGSALVFHRRVVHLDLFPGATPTYKDDDQEFGPTPNLDLRRHGGQR